MSIFSFLRGKRKDYRDKRIRELFKHRSLLALIIKSTIPEFTNCSIKEISDYIEPRTRGREKIVGNDTWKTKYGDSPSSVDLVFDLEFPSNHTVSPVSLGLVTLDFQSAFHRRKPYPIANRMVYYASTHYAGQEINTRNADSYAKLAPVVSIWIFTDIGKTFRNSICEISYSVKQLYGERTLFSDGEFAQTRMYAISIGEFDDIVDSELLEVLNTLLSGVLSAQQKVEKLSDKFPDSFVEEVRGGMLKMERQMAERLIPQLTEELIPQLKEELTPQLREELTPQLREELIPQLTEELIPQLTEKVRSEVEEKMHSELNEELRPEMEEKVRSELKEELRPEIKEELRAEIEAKLRAEIEAELRSRNN